MTDQRSWKYELDRVQTRFKDVAHESGPMKREWAGCQFFQFGPEGEETFLLTSPFIERIPLINLDAKTVKSVKSVAFFKR
jgi:hypothetical protein